MSFKYRYRKQILIVLIIVLIVTGGVGGSIYYANSYNKKSRVEKKEVLLATKKTTSVKKVSSKEKIEENKKVMVDIKGEVLNPGLYSLEEGSRVQDVINMAGGLTEIGDTTVINLGKKINDEMVIIIYSKQEVENFKQTKEILEQVIDSCQNSYDGLQNDACIEPDIEINTTNNKELSGNISINSATIEQLQKLPGIGEAKAKSIIEYREEHGNFSNIEELKNISGIGDALFDKIKESITL